MANKHTPKDIHLTGIRHAKEAICDLLNDQAAIVAERDRLREVNAELVAALETIANSTCDHGPGFCARDSARAALAKAEEAAA